MCTYIRGTCKETAPPAHVRPCLYALTPQGFKAVYGRRHTVTTGCRLAYAAELARGRQYGAALGQYRQLLQQAGEEHGPGSAAAARLSRLMGELEEEAEEAGLELGEEEEEDE